MSKFTSLFVTLLATSAVSVNGAPAPAVPLPTATVLPASDDPNYPLWNSAAPISPTIPQPIRGSLGKNIIAQQNVPLGLQNPDLFAPPTTDSGSVMNAHWPFSLSHNRLQTGGWARQQNADDMPVAKQLAGVDMRLEAGAIREMHWHTAAEWAYVLKGTAQVTTITPEGQNYLGNVHKGDLWYFPPGHPHSIQATADDPEGVEFLLVFDDGNFNEDTTFLLTDWLAHVPKEVIAKNFQNSISAFDGLPSHELYIFPSAPPPDNQPLPESPFGTTPEPYSYAFSQVPPRPALGGTFKVADSTTFKVAKSIAVAEITVEPGAMRELHWHPTQDEWTYFIEGQGRITLFAASSNAHTFDYQAGDIAYVPASYGHYVENTGNITLHFIEVYKSDRYSDISLRQWLALTPPELVKAHLGVSDETLQKIGQFKTEEVVLAPYTPAH